jgi:hypothetical protein
MSMIKKILVPMLSLILLSTPISVNFCLATASSTDVETSLCCHGENHPNHHQTTHNKSPTSPNHDCCNLAIESVAFYLPGLDSYPSSPTEILFHPLEITKSFYHPPRTHI